MKSIPSIPNMKLSKKELELDTQLAKLLQQEQANTLRAFATRDKKKLARIYEQKKKLDKKIEGLIVKLMPAFRKHAGISENIGADGWPIAPKCKK